jgi:hypothetical protein
MSNALVQESELVYNIEDRSRPRRGVHPN